MYKLFIDSLNNKVGVYQNGELVEFYDDLNNIEGNIYSAKVKNIVDDMEVAFCNIGIHKDCMLQGNDIKGFFENCRISKIINKSDFRLVQVIKNQVEDKGPKLTEKIKLTGKNVVLMFDKGVYFSNRLPINYKEKLLDLLNSYNFKYGVIFRSSSINISFDELILEIQELSNKFDEVINKFNNSSNVECLYDVGNVVDKLINDLYSDGLEVEVNEVEKLEILKLKYPKCSFQFIDKNLKYKMKSKVMLKSGGYLIIEKTFAGTMIDVNSGKNIISNKRGVFLDTNIEAAEEVARQLRLRDISGIIIVDFINLNNDEERKMVIDYFDGCTKLDRGKVNVVDFTKLRIA